MRGDSYTGYCQDPLLVMKSSDIYITMLQSLSQFSISSEDQA